MLHTLLVMEVISSPRETDPRAVCCGDMLFTRDRWGLSDSWCLSTAWHWNSLILWDLSVVDFIWYVKTWFVMGTISFQPHIPSDSEDVFFFFLPFRMYILSSLQYFSFNLWVGKDANYSRWEYPHGRIFMCFVSCNTQESTPNIMWAGNCVALILFSLLRLRAKSRH